MKKRPTAQAARSPPRSPTSAKARPLPVVSSSGAKAASSGTLALTKSPAGALAGR
jgi:hypothetical protein